MTVTSTNRKNQYTTNGSTVDFAFTFAITSTDQVKAITVGSDSIENDYTNFTLTINPSVEGGTLTTLDVLNNVDLVIYRDTPFTQEVDYVEGGRFPADSHEQALDKLTLQNQDQREELNRTLKSQISVDQAFELGKLDDGKLLGVNGSLIETTSASADDAESLMEYAEFAQEFVESDQNTAITPEGQAIRTLTGVNSEADIAISNIDINSKSRLPWITGTFATDPYQIYIFNNAPYIAPTATVGVPVELALDVVTGAPNDDWFVFQERSVTIPFYTVADTNGQTTIILKDTSGNIIDVNSVARVHLRRSTLIPGQDYTVNTQTNSIELVRGADAGEIYYGAVGSDSDVGQPTAPAWTEFTGTILTGNDEITIPTAAIAVKFSVSGYSFPDSRFTLLGNKITLDSPVTGDYEYTGIARTI